MTTFDDDYIRQFADRAIREALSDPENLRELIEETFPHLAPYCDFSQPNDISREFVMEDWRRRESDILFEILFHVGEDQAPIVICILIEHQTEADWRMPLRVLIYTVLYWGYTGRGNGKRGKPRTSTENRSACRR